MSGKSINFDDEKIKKIEFYQNTKVFQTDDVDVNKILVSKKEPWGTTNDANDNDNDNDAIRPLYVRLPQMTGYARKYDKNATRSIRANNKQLLKNILKYGKKSKSY